MGSSGSTPWKSQISKGLALAVICLAPVPFGSVDPLWVYAWVILVAGSVLVASDRYERSDWIVLAPFFLAVLVISASLVAWQMQRNGALLLCGAGPFDPAPGRSLGSVPACNPMLELGHLFLAALLFVRGYGLCKDERDAERMFRLLTILFSATALYGILSYFLDIRSLLWREKTSYSQFVTGTFVNKNTAATFFAAGFLVCTIEFAHGVQRRGWRILSFLRSGTLPSANTAFVLLNGFGAGVTLLAVILSGSRAGIVALGFTMGLCTFLFVYPAKHLVRVSWPKLAAVLFACLVLFEILGSNLTSRLQRDGLEDEARSIVYATTWKMVQSFPLTGIGLGNFGAVFPWFRPAQLASPGTWERAHSVWLQFAVELGLPVVITALALSVYYLGLLARGALIRTSGRHIPLIGFGVGLISVLHSAVDFSLQIPGFLAIAAAVIGAGLAQRVRTGGPAGRQVVPDGPPPSRRSLTAGSAFPHRTLARAEPPE